MVKPNLAFVNFFREQRGRRVVEVKDIVVPEGREPDSWPRHHADFEKDQVFSVLWPHLPNEGSASTIGEYEAHILCFGVTMEDLIHEAKTTGYKIPRADVVKYENVGINVKSSKKHKSPDEKKSSRGRTLKKSKTLDTLPVPAVPPTHNKRKKRLTDEESTRRERNKEFALSLEMDLPFPDDISENSAALEVTNLSQRIKVEPSLKSHNSNGHTGGKSDRDDQVSLPPAVDEGNKGSHSDNHRKSSSLERHSSDGKLISEHSSVKKGSASKSHSSSPVNSASLRHPASDKKLLDECVQRKSPVKESKGSHSDTHRKSSSLERHSSDGKLISEHSSVKKGSASKSHSNSPVNSASLRHPASDKKLLDECVQHKSPVKESKLPKNAFKRSEFDTENDPVSLKALKMKRSTELDARHSFSDIHAEIKSATNPADPEVTSECLDSHEPGGFGDSPGESQTLSAPGHKSEYIHSERKLHKNRRGSTKRTYIEAITSEDESLSDRSSRKSDDAITQLYVSKIQKLETQLKSLKRENIVLKEKLVSPAKVSGFDDNARSPHTPMKSARRSLEFGKTSRSKSRSKSPEGDFTDNATIADMILDAITNKAPLRSDGEGKLHIGNGVYISSKVFEDKIKAFKVSPSIALRDVMGNVYTSSELAKRSLEGGTPVKGGPDRKKLKKAKLTPQKRECFLGVYRAKTSQKSGSHNKDFLQLSVEKGGRSVIRDKLKEAAKAERLKEEKKAAEAAAAAKQERSKVAAAARLKQSKVAATSGSESSGSDCSSLSVSPARSGSPAQFLSGSDSTGSSK
ncbi:uncharacterized protein LOC113215190 isoform X2 [Frankliniella occidentalis]|uniref:Uncharacterized protein LOC113215190 isoform X2 n=1 Tax=Frankliniella occidentalis TaxID=133901 RepID=A0A9C6X3W6_FRAOC|nr:uncharacterized protein LOC113215190 isoform X2 [Frankliniella occidentalis]